MTPSSPLAGLLTGLVDGLIVAAVVLVVIQLLNRRHRGTTAVTVHPVAEDQPRASRRHKPADDLPRAA